MARYYQEADLDTILHRASALADSWPLKKYYEDDPTIDAPDAELEVLAGQIFEAGYEAARITGRSVLKEK